MDMDRNVFVSEKASRRPPYSKASTASPLFGPVLMASPSSTAGRTTAALMPSPTLPGVDVVVYEETDEQQL